MSKKQIALVALLLAAAAFIGFSRMKHYQSDNRLNDPLGTRLTFEYKGTVEGLFQKLSEASGLQYKIDPSVLKREVEGSFKNASIQTIQAVAAEKARLRYRPLELSGKVIGVNSR